MRISFPIMIGAVLGALSASIALADSHIGTGTAALCAAQPENGSWVNTDANTRSLTRIELRFNCQDVILNGQPFPPGPPWRVHVFGACSPNDCDWSEVEAERLGSDHIYAFYDQGFAKRHVYAKMSEFRPGQLWVYTYNDFVDPNREDYESQNWFRTE